MKAKLIFSDEMSEPILPDTFKFPKENQFQGTAREKVGEIACRICYDSMGAVHSRDSIGLHKHIQEVRHHSVYEHIYKSIFFEIKYERDVIEVLTACINRRGVFVEPVSNGVVITLNLRAALEWDEISFEISHRFRQTAKWIGNTAKRAFKADMPMALADLNVGDDFWFLTSAAIEPKTVHQKYMTMWLYGSRGFSHEMVRHRFNISQRSTRFVDEYKEIPEILAKVACEGEYVYHPLIHKYLADENVSEADKDTLVEMLLRAQKADHDTYKYVTDKLEPYAGNRKQARGAARGSLANALATELIYTASLYEWNIIFGQRATDAADAEIREVIVEAIQESGLPYEYRPAKDGLGMVATLV